MPRHGRTRFQVILKLHSVILVDSKHLRISFNYAAKVGRFSQNGLLCATKYIWKFTPAEWIVQLESRYCIIVEMSTKEATSIRIRIKLGVKLGITLLLMFAGVEHFLRPELFEQVMPPWIPAHHELVLFTGLCEIAGAIGIWVPKTKRLAMICLVVFLLAVFPVNVHMALHPELVPNLPPLLLWARLPLQFVLIGGVIWCCKQNDGAV